MNKKILLVEDNSSLSKIYKTALEQGGYTVVIARDGVEATYMADKEEYAAIVLDMLLPYKSGLEFLETTEIKKKKPATKIIVITNVPSQALIDETIKLGADVFLEKTHITPRSLVETVAQVIATIS